MKRALKTSRLKLRPIAESDHGALVARIMSDTDVMAWLPYSDQAATPEGQRELAAAYLNDFTPPWENFGFGIWAICSRDNELAPPGDFIGYCGFLPEQIKRAGPEIAFAVGKPVWGRGVATEALAACLDWIFRLPDIHRVHAVTDRDNLACRRVMEKIGLRHEKDVDLYDSVARGFGLLPYYAIERQDYLRTDAPGGGL